MYSSSLKIKLLDFQLEGCELESLVFKAATGGPQSKARNPQFTAYIQYI